MFTTKLALKAGVGRHRREVCRGPLNVLRLETGVILICR